MKGFQWVYIFGVQVLGLACRCGGGGTWDSEEGGFC
jgi:hypothetical protein